jgi:hypothetical protein
MFGKNSLNATGLKKNLTFTDFVDKLNIFIPSAKQ